MDTDRNLLFGLVALREGVVDQAQKANDVPAVLDPAAPADESRDRYTLSRLHARGGMGQVWLARDQALGRLIALKELLPDQAADAAIYARFAHEARITAQLEHPGIVPVYEIGQGEAPFYTMRFVRGRTLSEAIGGYHKKLAAGQADAVDRIELLTAFVGVCRAIAYAHSQGIIHRDLKGQNIALGNFGEVIVLDWGLAKRIRPSGAAASHIEAVTVSEPADTDASAPTSAGETTVKSGSDWNPNSESTVSDPSGPDGVAHPSSELTMDASATLEVSAHCTPGDRTPTTSAATSFPGHGHTIPGQLLGTPGYMAPEQAEARHDQMDERTDVYGLGAILYEILTGRPPFQARSASEIIHKICHEEPTRPTKIKAKIEPGLEAICLKALAKRSPDRYASASDLAHDVQRWLADLPVGAYAEPWTSRAMRWARRHKTLVGTAAVLLGVASIALAIISTRVASERNEAEAQGLQARKAVQLLTRIADAGFEEQLDPLQQEFLERSLAYYEQFTSRAASDTAIRFEHGRVFKQMGDIERKLGRPNKSERSYRRAIEIVEPLANSKSAGPEPIRALARTRTLLADLMVRAGGDTGEADRLYNQAIAQQQPLAAAATATAIDQLRLGQTLKSQADLLRLNGRFRSAQPAYDRAIAAFERARGLDPGHSEIQNDLAMATDARGWIHRELGDLESAERDFRNAATLLEALITGFPTSPRYRESLAKACNSLGLIEDSTGRHNDAETHFRRELTLVERLVEDFPKRPEYKRELARTWMNLGNVLSNQGRVAEAELALVRAVEVNAAIAAANPRDVQIRLDLSKSHTNLGELLRGKGNTKPALESLNQSRAIAEKLVSEFPDKPRYREQLAGTLTDIALALEYIDNAKSEENYQKSAAIFEKLVADHPDQIDYRIGLARCYSNFGPVLGASNRGDQAEALFQKALAALEPQSAAANAPECLRQRGTVQNNLGQLLLARGAASAEKTGIKDKQAGQRVFASAAETVLLGALATFEALVASKSSTRDDRQTLAIVHANLGENLVDLKRLDEAGGHLASAVAGFESLVAEQPKSIAAQSYFGMVLEIQARWLDQCGELAQAKLVLENAIAHQRLAVELSHNGLSGRERLGSHQLELAWTLFKLGADEEAERIALELPRTVPGSSRPRACFDAARILARRVSRLESNARLTQIERDRIARNDIGRLALLLREAIDSNPALAEPIKTDADIISVASQPKFREIIKTVVDLGEQKPK